MDELRCAFAAANGIDLDTAEAVFTLDTAHRSAAARNAAHVRWDQHYRLTHSSRNYVSTVHPDTLLFPLTCAESTGRRGKPEADRIATWQQNYADALAMISECGLDWNDRARMLTTGPAKARWEVFTAAPDADPADPDTYAALGWLASGCRGLGLRVRVGYPADSLHGGQTVPVVIWNPDWVSLDILPQPVSLTL